MNQTVATGHSKAYELEALEARLLLSADAVMAAGLLKPGPMEQACVIAVNSGTTGVGDTRNSLAYDPAAQVNDIFNGVPAEAIAAPAQVAVQRTVSESGPKSDGKGTDASAVRVAAEEPETEASQSATRVTTASPTASAAHTSLATTASSVSSVSTGGEISNPAPARQVMTLTAANSPPAEATITLSGGDPSVVNLYTLRLRGSDVELVNERGQILFNGALESLRGLNIVGEEDKAERFVVDHQLLNFASRFHLQIRGGLGQDTLELQDRAGVTREWTVDGPGSGHIGNLNFAGIENLIGGANNRDTFRFEAAGSIAGVVDGGAGGYDTLALTGGNFRNVEFGISGPDSGTIRRDRDLITYLGLEPTDDYTGGPKTFTGTAGVDTIVITDMGTASDNVLVVDIGIGEDLILHNASAVTSLTVNGLGGGDTITLNALDQGFAGALVINDGDGDDAITVNALTGPGPYSIATGLGNDTLYVHAATFKVTGGFSFDGGGGADSVNFQNSAGGYTQNLTLARSGSDVILTGADGSTLKLVGGSAETIQDANLTADTDYLGALLNDLEHVSDWLRKLAAFGNFASALPLLFGGDQTVISAGNVLAFADSIDAIRADLHAYYNSLLSAGSSFSVDALQTRLRNIADGIVQYAGSIVGDFVPSFGALDPNGLHDGDVAHFNIALDGVGTALAVTFTNPTSIEAVVGQINAALGNTALAGKVFAKALDGRLGFEVRDPKAVNYTISCAANDPAFRKLGLRLSQTIPVVQATLGQLAGVASKLVQSARVWTTIDPLTLVPKLNLDLPFSLTRRSSFGADFSKDLREASGVAFDASATLNVTAKISASLSLGLNLDAAKAFALNLNSLAANVSLDGSSFSGDLTLGFLGAHIAGTVNLDAGLTLAAPVAVTDFSSLSGVSLVPDAAHRSFSASFTVSVLPGLDSSGSSFNPAGVTLSLANADPFDPSSFAFDRFTTSGGFSDLFSFSNLTPAGMVSLLNRLASNFDDIANSDRFSAFKIPFLSASLSDVLDFVNTARKAIFFDDGPDGAVDDGKALVTDLNDALAKAGLASRFKAQGDGSHVTLIATDTSITGFSAAGLSAIGLNGAATLAGHAFNLTGTPVNNGVLANDGVLSLTVTTSAGTKTYNVSVTAKATADNTRVGDDVAKLINAAGSATFRTAQEFASQLITLLNLDRGLVKPNYDPNTQELTFRIQFDATLPGLLLPVDFNLPLGAFGGFQSNGKLTITPNAGLDLTFGVRLGSGGTLSTSTALADLQQPVVIALNPAFTAGDLAAYAVYGRLSGDAVFNVTLDGDDYQVKVLKSATATNLTATDLAVDVNAALMATHKIVSGQPELAATDLTGKLSVSANGARLSFTVKAATTPFTLDLNPPNSSLLARELGLQKRIKQTADASAHVFNADKDVVASLGTSPASFTITMGGGGPSAVITLDASATNDNRNTRDLVSDLNSALADTALKTRITVESQGNALVFKSTDATTFTITAGNDAEKLGLGSVGHLNLANNYDLLITLSNGVSYPVALKKNDGTAALTIADLAAAIARDTLGHVTLAIDSTQRALELTDDTFVPFVGAQSNPNPTVFRVTALNNSNAGGKLTLISADAVPGGANPDGKITGSPLAGIALADRLFIKAPGANDPPMLHASLSLSTGAGLAATARFAFVAVSLSGTGTIEAGVGVSLADPGTSSADGRITLGEIATALTTSPASLLAAPTIVVDPAHAGRDHFDFTLALISPTIPGFNPSGTVTFSLRNFGNPFGSPITLPDIAISKVPGLDSFFASFSHLSFSNILAVLSEVISKLDSFEGAGPIGSFKIPLLNLSVHDLLSSVNTFTAALQSLTSNPAGTLQVLTQKLVEALGIPVTVSLDGPNILKFNLALTRSIQRGLDLNIPEDLLSSLSIPGFPHPTLTGGASLDFTGTLNLTLDFGIDLFTIDPANSSYLPTIYIYNDTGISGSVVLAGNNVNFLAGIGPFSVAIDNGSAAINGTFSVSVGDGQAASKTSLSNFLGALTASLGGSIGAELPVSFSSLSIGRVWIDAGTNLASFRPSDFHVSLELPDLANMSIWDNLLLASQGLDTFLGGLQDLLTGQVFSANLPLIGGQLAKGGQFIAKLRNDFVAPFRQAIEAAQNAAQNFADPRTNVISSVIYSLLGPGTAARPGLNLLQPLGADAAAVQENFVRLITNLDRLTPATAGDAMIEWDFTIGGTYNLGPNISFDIGLPGLGLAMDGTLNANLYWKLHLGLGFDLKDGFYLVIGNPDDPTDTNWKDLEVGLDLGFSPGAALTGKLAFLQLTAANDETIYTDNDANFADTDVHGTGLTAAFAIDLTNGTTNKNHLGFTDITKLKVTPQVRAAAAIELALTLGLNPGVVGGGIASGMPKVKADFILDWSLDGDANTPGLQFENLSTVLADPGGAMQHGLNLVEFGNLRLDVGSFVTDVLGPIVEKVKEVTEPFQPIIDIITAPIPVISDLAGSPVTMLDLAAQFGHVDAGMIEAVADIIKFVNDLPGPGETDNLEIPLLPVSQAFKIFQKASSDFSSAKLWDKGFKLASQADDLIHKAGTFTADQLKQQIASADTHGNAKNNAAKSSLNSMFGGAGSAGKAGRGFSFPIFDDPSQIFYLLLGKNTDIALVEYRLPILDFQFTYSQFFPIFGPLGASIAGTVGIHIDLGFGYDTRGIKEFIDSEFRHPEYLFDGFYLTDLDKQGNDIPELTLFGGITAAAELNLGVASGGVGGGIGVTVDFNLHENDHDGRVRLGELLENIVDEAEFGNAVFAPLAVFDISGRVFARLFAFFSIDLGFWSWDWEQNIVPEITLVDFSINFTRAPKLATLSDSGELRLNMGLSAGGRLNGDLNDGDESFTVTHVGGSAGDETVAVSSAFWTHPQTYQHVKTLVIEGGEGNDHITIHGVRASMTISGGAGDDVITLDNAATGTAVIHGNEGNDTITGGGGKDVIYGGLGTDTIYGGGGDDVIFGDDGSVGASFAESAMAANDSADHLYGDNASPFGTDGNDLLFGGGGDDDLHGGGGGDILIGDAGTVALANGSGNWSLDWSKGVAGTSAAKSGGADRLYGEAGDDYLFGGAGGDFLYGGADADHIFGEAGFDTIYGDDIARGATDGNDIIFGDGWSLLAGKRLNNADPATELLAVVGGEADVIRGGGGADWIYSGGGNDSVHGDDGDDFIFGGSGADTLNGDANDDHIYGGSENDTLFGDAGDDTLSGEAGNDALTGGSGNDTLFAGFGSDALDGQEGSDSYIIYSRGGTATNLTTVYDTGTGTDDYDTMTINGTSENDVFLLRAMALPNQTTPDTGFVAKLNHGLNNTAPIERFNYRRIEDITLNTLYGDDYVAADDTVQAIFTINGGEGRDQFQIGQVFNSPRDSNPDTANLSGSDQYATLAITRGWLSNGTSAPMVINGGGDDDVFTIFHNKGALQLNGGDGDDNFTVRSFALVGSVDSQRARTDIKGDAGADTIRYAVNAPVGVDGGDGFDSLQVIGTEFSDDFVITDGGVFGAGRYTTYVNLEKLTVDGAEGNDRYFVLSSDPNVVTEIDGGLGSDSFYVGGSPSDGPIPVVAPDFRGHSGIILHNIENSGTPYDGLKIDGLSANVGDNETPFIVVKESGGVSSVTEEISSGLAGVPAEGWDYDTYTITLTKAPLAGEDVKISIGAQQPSPEDAARGYATLEFWDAATSAWVAHLVLHFTSANAPQTVKFRAIHDSASEGKQFAMINHLIQSNVAGSYDLLPIRSVRVQINDDDRAGVIVSPTGASTQVIEGGLTDNYYVVLTRPPTADVTVTLASYFGQVTLSGATLNNNQLTFTPADYNHAQLITVTALDDSAKEGFRTDFLSHTATSSDVDLTLSRSRYQLDGDPTFPGINAIPAAQPLDNLLLADRPIPGTVQVWVDGQLRVDPANSATPRFLVSGNTLVFLARDGFTPEAISGKIEVQYDYVRPGYHGRVGDRVVVDVADNDVPQVVILEPDGGLDTFEGGATTSYQLVLTQQPTNDVTIDIRSMATRTTGSNPVTGEGFAHFQQQVLVNGVLTTHLTFSNDSAAPNAWNKPQTVTVAAIDDTMVDGDETKVFAPVQNIVDKIRGPLFVEGASGAGSLSFPAPLMLPGEKNIRQSDGTVINFSPSSAGGGGAVEQMTVRQADLLAAIARLADPGITALHDLIGKTLELTQGPGTGVVLDPARPYYTFNRFWLITDVASPAGALVRLTLQNPSQVDPAAAGVTAPDHTTKFAITALSTNFFADERQQVDYLTVFDQDSVADKTGQMTSAVYNTLRKGRILGLGLATDPTTIGGSPEPGGLRYGDLEVVAVNLGAGNDHLSVDYTTFWSDHATRRDGEFVAWTLLNTGAGDDTVTVNLLEGQDGALALNTQAGNDHVYAQDSTLPLVILGGTGDDEIKGGKSADILFGDIGRVDYVNGEGFVVTRLGHTWAQSPVNPPVTSATATSLSDGTASFPTSYGGLAGLSIQAISSAGFVQYRTIVSNTTTTITVDRPWDTTPDASYYYRVSMSPENQTDGTRRGPRVIWAIDEAAGGNDSIDGNAGADVIIGGAGHDTLSGGTGNDYLAGDNARFDFSPLTGSDGPTKLDVAQTIAPQVGGNDTLSGGAGADLVLGGAGGDTIYGDDAGGSSGANDGSDVILGDNGILNFTLSGDPYDNDPLTLDRACTTDPALGGSDTISGNAGDDLILGGAGGDFLYGNTGDDLVLGDFGEVRFSSITINRLGSGTAYSQLPVFATTTDDPLGGADTIFGNEGEDVLAGGANDDNVDGGAGDDLIFGDNVMLDRSTSAIYNDFTNPRFRTLGGALYDANGNATVDGAARNVPALFGTPSWGNWDFSLLDHTQSAGTLPPPNTFGDDYLAGGPDDDTIFGQLGDDTIQGDGSISVDGKAKTPTPVFALRLADGSLQLNPSVEAATDGDDYIEGNGGNDVIFGNLGQDDIIGDSSSLFSLDSVDERRPVGSDLIFGGAGTRISRNDAGDTTANGHARDADVILGDNGNIYRLVTSGNPLGAFLTFNYDDYAGSALRLVVRAAQWLDYTPGGPDFNRAGAATDLGAADELHGESGDDFLYGLMGNDVLFGDGQDDDLIGGYGNDWLSGGTGEDGLLGDDGRIFTSRNGQTEPLNGVLTAATQQSITTPGRVQNAETYPIGLLMKSANLTPFSTDPGWTPTADEFNGVAIRPHDSDDILFGGLGNDWLHGGSGDDAMSGGEALPVSYAPVYNPATGAASGLMQTDFYHPRNPGDALHFNPADLDGHHANAKQAGEFALYDEYDALRKIQLNDDGSLYKGAGTAKQFFLNFNQDEGPSLPGGPPGNPNNKGQTYPSVHTDGNDKLFGDLGNDWLVGGTGRDDLFGGFGNDLLNADDNLDTTATSSDTGANNAPDTHPSYEDRAYGGAGRDVLIANTGGDRLIDWAGEFNSYLVPFAPYGISAITRALQPGLMDFLYQLSVSDGADATRATDTGSDPIRNGEPYGELGLVLQHDVAWHEQTGAPSDPQAGNLNGGQRDVRVSAATGKRDVLVSPSFSTDSPNPFRVERGSWKISNGGYLVNPMSGGDAVSLLFAEDGLPDYFEAAVTINACQTKVGDKTNAYLIFDYRSATDFKFAGVDVAQDKVRIGQRTAAGWTTLAEANLRLDPGQDYAVELTVNGPTVSLAVKSNKTLTCTFDQLLNYGLVGLGTDNALSRFSEFQVKILPPLATLEAQETFSNGVTTPFTTQTGLWQMTDHQFSGSLLSGAASAVSTWNVGALPGDATGYQLQATVSTQSLAGLVFDFRDALDFKFVALRAGSNQVVLGHRTALGWILDEVIELAARPNSAAQLSLIVEGSTVRVAVDGQAALRHTYTGSPLAGQVGLLAFKGTAQFDDLTWSSLRR